MALEMVHVSTVEITPAELQIIQIRSAFHSYPYIVKSTKYNNRLGLVRIVP